MADLTYIQATQEVKIVGQDDSGNNANYVGADNNGNMQTKDYSGGPVSPGVAALSSLLIGGQYNSTLPVLTTTQQSAVQLDSSGKLLISSNGTVGTVAPTIAMYNGAIDLYGNIQPLKVDSLNNLNVIDPTVGQLLLLIYKEFKRHTLLLQKILGATGNHPPDNNTLDSEIIAQDLAS